MLKYAILVLLVFVVGCKTLPNFPIVWFYTQQDLQNQERGIDSFYKRRD